MLRFVDNWKHRLDRTWKCMCCIMQMSYLYASDFPFKNFCKIAQHTETIRKNVWEKKDNPYSLSIRVSTDHDKPYFNFYVFMPWWNITCCLQFRRNTLANCYYFLVAIDSCKILTQVGQEWGNFKALKRCYIKIYQSDILLYYEKAIELQHI